MPQSTAKPVTVSYISAPSLTSTSHVRDGSTFSANYVDNSHPTSANYVMGTILFTLNHRRVTSPTYIHHEGKDYLPSSSHDESLSPTVVNTIGGIEKPRRLRRKPKFLCKTCEGIHLTHFCPTTTGILEVWGSPKIPSEFDTFVVCPHTNSPLIVSVVLPS
jgi:hypothetical protein